MSQEETLARSLREAFEGFNQTVSIVNPVTVNPPEFSASPSQDIVDWLDKYEQVTLNLDDEHKKKLLVCAFTKSARAWFKDDLQPLLEDMAWGEVKKAILQRYKPDHQDHYVLKLGKLKYVDDDSEDLASFVDQRVHVSKLAYPNLSDKEVIRDTILAMCPNVKKEINMTMGADKLTTIADLKALARRYDQQIKINEGKANRSLNILDRDIFADLVQKASDKAVEKVIEQVAAKTEVLAAAIYKKVQKEQQPQMNPPDANNNMYAQGYQHQQRGQYSNPMRFQNQLHYGPQQHQQPMTNQYSQQLNNQQHPNSGIQSAPQPFYQPMPQTSNSYFQQTAQYGPPKPCRHCKGNHWNRDCPTLQQQPPLNGQGC